MLKRITLAATVFIGHYLVVKPKEIGRPEPTSERHNGFYINRSHLKEVVRAKEALMAKNPSQDWLNKQNEVFPKGSVKTVSKIAW